VDFFKKLPGSVSTNQGKLLQKKYRERHFLSLVLVKIDLFCNELNGKGFLKVGRLKSEDRRKKTEESANLRSGPIRGKFMKKGNWSAKPCFQG